MNRRFQTVLVRNVTLLLLLLFGLWGDRNTANFDEVRLVSRIDFRFEDCVLWKSKFSTKSTYPVPCLLTSRLAVSI